MINHKSKNVSVNSANNEKQITLDKDVTQTGNIRVHSNIIKDLSSGIYSSPASCIKELVNNSYDADATLVTIRIKPIKDSIVISDDGSGMNAVEFEKNFAWISKSNKRNHGDFTPMFKRPLIGKIGIGFIAVNEICDKLIITSSKVGEDIKFTATIDFKEYAEKDVLEDDGIIKGGYLLVNEDEEKSSHYTIITLVGLKNTVKQLLKDQQYSANLIKLKNKNFERYFFESMKNVIISHSNSKLRSYGEDNEYVKFLIDLSSYIPVQYIDGAPIEGTHDKIIDSIVKKQEALNFKVDLDGIYLKKPIFFPKVKNMGTGYFSFKEELKVEDSLLKFKGYFYVQHGILFPRELNGVSIRIKNVPIAERFGYDNTFLRYPNYTDQIFRNWVSGEIYIEEGLEEAMNIDRKSFRFSHPQFQALQNFIHELLSKKILGEIAKDLYEKGKSKRDTKKSKNEKVQLKKILGTKHIDYKESSPTSKKKDIPIINILEKTVDQSTIEVNISKKEKFNKKDWEYLEKVFIIFEVAFKECGHDLAKFKKLFYDKINDWKGIED